MRTYKRKNTDVPHGFYMAMKNILGEYDRLKTQKTLLEQGSSPPANGMPRGSGTSNPTENKAIILAAINEKLCAIDQTCVEIRGMYSGKTCDDFNPIKAFWDYGYFNLSYLRKGIDDEGPSYRTWNNFKYCFAKKMANKLNFF